MLLHTGSFLNDVMDNVRDDMRLLIEESNGRIFEDYPMSSFLFNRILTKIRYLEYQLERYGATGKTLHSIIGVTAWWMTQS